MWVLYGSKELWQVNNFHVPLINQRHIFLKDPGMIALKKVSIMFDQSIGKYSFKLTRPPVLLAWASVAGKKGLVPAPAAGDNEKLLCGDGTFTDKVLTDAQYTALQTLFS